MINAARNNKIHGFTQVKTAEPSGQKLYVKNKSVGHNLSVSKEVSTANSLLLEREVVVRNYSYDEIKDFLFGDKLFIDISADDKLQLAMNLFYTKDPLSHAPIFKHILEVARQDYNFVRINKRINELEEFIKTHVMVDKINTIFKDQKQFDRVLLGQIQLSKNYINMVSKLLTTLRGRDQNQCGETMREMFECIEEFSEFSRDVNNVPYNQEVFVNQALPNFFYNTCSDAGFFAGSLPFSSVERIGVLGGFGSLAGLGFAANIEAGRKPSEILLQEIGLYKHLVLMILSEIKDRMIFTPEQIKVATNFLDIKRGSFAENLFTQKTNSRKYFDKYILAHLTIKEDVNLDDTLVDEQLAQSHRSNNERLLLEKNDVNENNYVEQVKIELITSADIKAKFCSLLKIKDYAQLVKYINKLTTSDQQLITKLVFDLKGFRGTLLGFIINFDARLSNESGYNDLKTTICSLYQQYSNRIYFAGFGKNPQTNNLYSLADLIKCDYLEFCKLLRQYRPIGKKTFLCELALILFASLSNPNITPEQQKDLQEYLLNQLHCKGEGSLEKIRVKKQVFGQNTALGVLDYEVGLNAKKNFTMATNINPTLDYIPQFMAATGVGVAGWVTFSTLATTAEFLKRGATETYKQAEGLLRLDLSQVNLNKDYIPLNQVEISEPVKCLRSKSCRLANTMTTNTAEPRFNGAPIDTVSEKFALENVDNPVKLERSHSETDHKKNTATTINACKRELNELLHGISRSNAQTKYEDLLGKVQQLERLDPTLVYMVLSDSDDGKTFLFYHLQKAISELETYLGTDSVETLAKTVNLLWVKVVQDEYLWNEHDSVSKKFMDRLNHGSFNHAREALLEFYELLAIIATAPTEGDKVVLITHLTMIINKSRYDPTSKWYTLLKRCARDEIILRSCVRAVGAILWAAGSAVATAVGLPILPTIALLACTDALRGVLYGSANNFTHATIVGTPASKEVKNKLQNFDMLNIKESENLDKLDTKFAASLKNQDDVSCPKLNEISNIVKQFSKAARDKALDPRIKDLSAQIMDNFTKDQDDITIFAEEDNKYIKTISDAMSQESESLAVVVGNMIKEITPPDNAGKYAHNQAFYRIIRNIWVGITDQKKCMAILLGLFIQFNIRELSSARVLSTDRSFLTKSNYLLPHAAFGAFSASTSVVSLFDIDAVYKMLLGGCGDYIGGLMTALGLNNYPGGENTKSWRNNQSMIKDLLFVLYLEIGLDSEMLADEKEFKDTTAEYLAAIDLELKRNNPEMTEDQKSALLKTKENITAKYPTLNMLSLCENICNLHTGRNFLTRTGATRHGKYIENSKVHKKLSTQEYRYGQNLSSQNSKLEQQSLSNGNMLENLELSSNRNSIMAEYGDDYSSVLETVACNS